MWTSRASGEQNQKHWLSLISSHQNRPWISRPDTLMSHHHQLMITTHSSLAAHQQTWNHEKIKSSCVKPSEQNQRRSLLDWFWPHEAWSGLLRVFKDVKTFRTSKDDLSITQTTEERKSFNQSRKQTSHWPVWASVRTTTTVHQLTFSSVGTSVMRWVISCWSRHFKLNNRILLKVMGLVLVVLVVLVVLMVQRQTGEAAAACHSSRTTD